MSDCEYFMDGRAITKWEWSELPEHEKIASMERLQSQLSAAVARAETAEAQRDEAAGHLAECLRFLKIFTTRKEAVSKPESFLSRLASGGWKPDPRLGLTVEKLTQLAKAVIDAASYDAMEERMDSYEQRCFLSQELDSIIAALEPADGEGKE